VGVCVASGGEDGAGLYAGLEALFLESEGLQVWEGEAVGGALYLHCQLDVDETK
jgi:hypothetical protein